MKVKIGEILTGMHNVTVKRWMDVVNIVDSVAWAFGFRRGNIMGKNVAVYRHPRRKGIIQVINKGDKAIIEYKINDKVWYGCKVNIGVGEA